MNAVGLVGCKTYRGPEILDSSRAQTSLNAALDATQSSTSQSTTFPTNWNLCVICQYDKNEPFQCPSHSTQLDKLSRYKSLAENIIRFHELGELPRTLQLARLDDGHGVEETLSANNDKWHELANCNSTTQC